MKYYENFKSGEGVCYVADLSMQAYTRKDLEKLLEEFGFNHNEAEHLFDELEWQHPETILDEWSEKSEN